MQTHAQHMCKVHAADFETQNMFTRQFMWRSDRWRKTSDGKTNQNLRPAKDHVCKLIALRYRGPYVCSSDDAIPTKARIDQYVLFVEQNLDIRARLAAKTYHGHTKDLLTTYATI
jgi:hypothetical protein